MDQIKLLFKVIYNVHTQPVTEIVTLVSLFMKIVNYNAHTAPLFIINGSAEIRS